MIAADLYLSKIDLLKYLPGTDCGECGEPSCAAFVKQLKRGKKSPIACPFIGENQARAFEVAVDAERLLPEVPALDLPRPALSGLVEVNQPDRDSLLLVSGNNQFTQEVLTSVMALTLSPFWLLLVDCRGDTVDMAMIYQSLTAAKIAAALEATSLPQDQRRRQLILPGFASGLKQALESRLDWQVRVGPICIAELPLFLGEEWQLPPGISLEPGVGTGIPDE